MKRAERTSIQDILITLVRMALGMVFIVASIDKIADPTAFATSVTGYRIVPQGPAMLMATVLPWIELLCGLGLVLGRFVRGSTLLALVMLTVFTIAVLSALWRGLDISCGCYTQEPNAERLGWWKVGENGFLLMMSVLIWCRSRIAPTLERFLQHQSEALHKKE